MGHLVQVIQRMLARWRWFGNKKISRANMIPENLISLHKGEEQVRAMSLEAIAKSEDMSLHLSLIERAADLIHYFIHRDEHRDEDDLIIRLLGMRMFNCLNP